MSWMPGWKRQSDTFHLSLGYGDSPPIIDSASSPRATSSDPAESCKYHVSMDWPAGEEDEQVALRLQSKLMVTLPPPVDHVQVRLRYPARAVPRVSLTFQDATALARKLLKGQETQFQTPDGGNGDGEKESDLKRFKSEEGDAANEDRLSDQETKEDSENGAEKPVKRVGVQMKVVKFREPLKVVSLSRTQIGGGPPSDGLSMLTRVLGPGSSDKAPGVGTGSVSEELLGYTQHWRSLTVLSLAGCGLSAVPSEISRLPMLEVLYLDNNRIGSLPPEMGQLSRLRILTADHNLLSSVPIEFRQCEALEELSLEHNKLVRPLLDFRALGSLRILRLFGNPLEFFPEILPCTNLRQLSLANVRIESDPDLVDVRVTILAEAAVSYFGASKHKLSAFFALIFRYSSVHHPLLASALAKICEDPDNRTAISKDEGAIRQIVSMILSDSRHVVEQACLALSSLASDPTVVPHLMKADVVQSLERPLRSKEAEVLVSVLKVIASLAFTSEEVALQLLSPDTVSILLDLGFHSHVLVQKEALMALGSLSFYYENRRLLLATQGLRDRLLALACSQEGSIPVSLSVRRAATRCLAILGENEALRQAVQGRGVGPRGVRILSMDGGGMRGMATVRMLREMERRVGKRLHECFDLVCGTSTGGMLAVALGLKQLSLDQCEDVYKRLGKMVFEKADAAESASWREKLDSIYKSSSQNLRVMVHGSKHSAEEFERLLKDLLSDEDGNLLIDNAVRPGPKVFLVSTLVSVLPATPFIFRNYQYPPGIPETPLWPTDGSLGGSDFQVVPRKAAYVGSCKFQTWEAVRASSAAPYYLDDYSNGSYRWEDGAIFANNPSVIALREARLIWPDHPIDCLVSLGCGQLPNKPRGKGGWRIADTGQVLVEAACSVERSEEIIDTFLPLIPDMKYYRFQPIDDRCGMELDETDPAHWRKLEAATDDYLSENLIKLIEMCDHLREEEDQGGIQQADRSPFRAVGVSGRLEEKVPLLGFRRQVLLVEASREQESKKQSRMSKEFANFFSSQKMKYEFLPLQQCSREKPPEIKPVPAKHAPSTAGMPGPPLPATNPPPSPIIKPESPRLGPNEGSPLALDSRRNSQHTLSPVLRGRVATEPNLSPQAQLLLDKLESSTKIGVVHLSLPCDSHGFVVSWRNDVFSVAEPSEIADSFLAQALASLAGSRHRWIRQLASKVESLMDLVSMCPTFTIGDDLYQFIGRYSQVLQNGLEVGAFMFKRTIPSVRITEEDARWMVGAWRDRVIVCTGLYAPPVNVLTAILDSGAKAVICPAHVEAPGSRDVYLSDDDDVAGADMEGGAEGDNGEEEVEAEDSLLLSEERNLLEFFSTFYGGIFELGLDLKVSLRKALKKYPKMKFVCHFPF